MTRLDRIEPMQTPRGATPRWRTWRVPLSRPSSAETLLELRNVQPEPIVL
jgi:hypothetical protein